MREGVKKNSRGQGRPKRSRRRRGSRTRELFMSCMALVFLLILAAGAAAGGVCGYRYWQGSRVCADGVPLETSRQVVFETMEEEKEP